MLIIEGLHAYYEDSHILRGVSLTVQAGEAVALLGRNGAGKSTTINAVMGFVPVRQGKILLAKQEISRLPPHQRAQLGVGLVPQGRHIFPTLTVRENMTLAARNSVQGGWSFERVLQLFPPLAARLSHWGKQLSGGEQQMLAIARALMTNPRLLLLDEPSEGLAPLLVTAIGQVIQQLCQEGLSILLVEQNLKLAFDVVKRVYVMSKGQVVFEGKPADLGQQPALLQRYLGV
jgi:branched-chain amino acid transport system ATP-binding protein